MSKSGSSDLAIINLFDEQYCGKLMAKPCKAERPSTWPSIVEFILKHFLSSVSELLLFLLNGNLGFTSV
jgi:hypothetical protein